MAPIAITYLAIVTEFLTASRIRSWRCRVTFRSLARRRDCSHTVSIPGRKYSHATHKLGTNRGRGRPLHTFHTRCRHLHETRKPLTTIGQMLIPALKQQTCSRASCTARAVLRARPRDRSCSRLTTRAPRPDRKKASVDSNGGLLLIVHLLIESLDLALRLFLDVLQLRLERFDLTPQ